MQFTFAGIQMDIKGRAWEENLSKGLSLVERAADRGARLVCLPELFTTGFDYPYVRDTAEPVPGPATERLGEAASASEIYLLAGSMAEKCGNKIYNTAVLFGPDGKIIRAIRKVHLFPLMDEHLHFSPGEETAAVATELGTIGILVCYDIRFPELARTLTLDGAGILLLPAEFPHPRLDHWRVLLQARAIENQVYVAGVNRVGSDGGTRFFGHTSVYDPWGNLLASAGEDESIVYADVDTEKIREARAGIPCLAGRKPEVYRLA